MRIDIIVLTRDEIMHEYIGLRKAASIPRESRQKNFPSHAIVNVASFFYSNVDKTSEFHAYISRLRHASDFIIMLYEYELQKDLDRYFDCLFTTSYETHSDMNTHNYMSMMLSKTAKSFNIFYRYFSDQKFTKIMLLPLKNFEASELVRLRGLFRARITSATFPKELEDRLAELRRRQTPKKFSTYQTVYLRDDGDRYFSYGNERHSQVESQVPPHSLECGFNSCFRFGMKYDATRHFNVSQAKPRDKIAGQFWNCHGSLQTVPPQSHINMFPNDFIA